MKTIYYLIALVMLSLGMIIFTVGNSQAGGPWIDQYCDVETTQIRVIDQQGNVVEEKVEEKVTCNDAGLPIGLRPQEHISSASPAPRIEVSGAVHRNSARSGR
jgi:hypothetical protein